MNLSSWLLLAADNANATPPNSTVSLMTTMLPVVAIGVLFWVMMLRPEQKKRNEHRSLLEALKKNDRVVTIGGLYGVVTNVQKDSDRITLRVDETTNTKVDVTFGSIARVITDAPAAESTAK